MRQDFSGAHRLSYSASSAFDCASSRSRNFFSANSFDILCAHPTANGFLGARFPAGGIPHAYSLILKQFFDSLIKKNQAHKIRLLEYIRPGWTFHAKGIWYFLFSYLSVHISNHDFSTKMKIKMQNLDRNVTSP